MTALSRRPVGGFTLLELLIVVAIVASLAGLLMPLLRIADRSAKATATRAVMAKVDTACRLFRSELGPYPYQPTYADLAAGEAWTNRLFYQLGTDIAKDDRDKVIADADNAAKLYTVGNPPPYAPYAFQFTDLKPSPGWAWGFATLANRMAAERARIAIYSGNIGIAGPKLRVPYYLSDSGSAYIRRVIPSDPLLSPSGTPPRRATSSARPGLAKDYLHGEIARSHIAGDAVLDAWHQPLIYVCQVVEGMGTAFMMQGNGLSQLNSIDFGLQALGRISLNVERIDRATGDPVVADPPRLPDLNNMRHSDRRSHAPSGMELEFELWSAGPDGKADWMRDGPGNADNVPLSPYDAKIP